MSSPSVIVVGAGGIATAARLAKEGFRVKVVEKHGFVGGRCSLIHDNGFVRRYASPDQSHLIILLTAHQRFDQGPSLLLMPELFHQTFHDLNTSLSEEGVAFLKCEPNYCIWFADHDCFQLSTDLAKMKLQIDRHEGEEGFQKFLAFMQEAGKHYELSLKHVLQRNFPDMLSMLRPAFLLSVFSMHPFQSIYGRISRYFRSEKLRRVFTFASMYLGMNPFEAPGTYSLLQFTELAHGIAYPAGGFQKILRALARVGERFGVEYCLNSPVSSIILRKQDKVISGVRLESGKELYADIVVINADLVYAYNNLLPPSKAARMLSKRAASCSSISFFWSFDRVIPELQTHNVFLAEEYRESFDAIFKRHSLPDEPSFYVNVPSRIDPTAAPKGKDAVVVLVPVGHLDEHSASSQQWESLVDRVRVFILNTIEARTGVKGLDKFLLHETIQTPLDWKSKFNLDRGAILGLSHSFFNVLSFRPRNKHAEIDGLYFVGASTHPGTGVPVCLAGGKVVSEQIIDDWNKKQSSSTRRPLCLIFLALVFLLYFMILWHPFNFS
ncbi:unnamed protein product [Penicillium olsonii]|uniref:Phytoene desaturase n=1 Tax=Penicillium olsonii TaxID=99116 RepID=A0A9W4HLT4_PENOL|nr:unnamed protein product [Penicillium olsonii]